MYQQNKNALSSSGSSLSLSSSLPSPSLINSYSKDHHGVLPINEDNEKLLLASSSNFRADDSNSVQAHKTGSYFDGYYEEG